MLNSRIIAVGDVSVLGIKVDLPGAPVLMLVGEKGFIGCGYFKMETADKVGHALAVVSGVKSFEDMLAASVIAVSEQAAKLGVTVGMTGSDAVKLIA
ncbi:YunC family protein [Verrucomicrobiota bacterium]